MSYLAPRRPTRGSGCGCIVAIALVILGWPMLFATVWGCVPEHRIAGAEPCSQWNGRLIFLGILIVAAAAFWLVKRLVDRADAQSDE
jgi:type VI protein secretion system component VasK